MSHSLRGQRLSPSAHRAVYLCGRGPIGRALGTYLRSFQIDDRNKIAKVLALEYGCPLETLDDPAVMGWSADRQAKCAPSVALRNALNSLRPAERDALAAEVASRFLLPDSVPEKIVDKHHLIARDGRIVAFDDALSHWHLDKYVAT